MALLDGVTLFSMMAILIKMGPINTCGTVQISPVPLHNINTKALELQRENTPQKKLCNLPGFLTLIPLLKSIHHVIIASPFQRNYVVVFLHKIQPSLTTLKQKDLVIGVIKCI